MYAIIQTGGKQYKAEVGDVISVENWTQRSAQRSALTFCW